MKRILSLLLAAMPAVCFAQENEIQPEPKQAKPPTSKFEVGVTGGLAFDSHMEFLNNMYIFNFNTASFLFNINKMQIGMGVDVDFADGEHTLLAPHLIINKTHQYKHGYFYAGGMGGYARANREQFWGGGLPASNGFILGLQTGITFNLSKRFSVNAETGVRSTQLWVKEYQYYFHPYAENYEPLVATNQYFSVYFPSKIGIRYRFGY